MARLVDLVVWEQLYCWRTKSTQDRAIRALRRGQLAAFRGRLYARDVFTRTWRHTFVPRFYVKDDPQDWRAPWRVVDGTKPDDRVEWLDGVYSNQTLITELTKQSVPEELGGGTAQVITSGSSPRAAYRESPTPGCSKPDPEGSS